tara:strand:+ start:238 stop:594 length:357 start_codon:yes stop_codon:yes gene_type:complete
LSVVDKNRTIEITEKAVANAKRLMEKEGNLDQVVRVGVKGGGCSGLSYVLRFEDKEKTNPLIDQVLENNSVSFVIDKKSLIFLAGTVLDFEDGLNGQGFTFKNPNARQSCGCGESFSA